MCQRRQKSVMLSLLYGALKLRGKWKPSKEGDADGHVAVATEVAVDLHGITIHTQQIFEATVESGVVEDAVDEVETDVVADDSLFEQSDHDEVDATGEHLAGDDDGFAYLWGKVGGAHDGAGHELGEERYVEGVVHE